MNSYHAVKAVGRLVPLIQETDDLLAALRITGGIDESNSALAARVGEVNRALVAALKEAAALVTCPSETEEVG